MLLTKQQLAHKAIEAAEKVGVPPELVCAIIEVSSEWDAALIQWNPDFWLISQHPLDVGLDKWSAMGTRWGAMQVLGQHAWHAGYKTLERLGETEENLLAGCMFLKKILVEDERKTLLSWFGMDGRHLANKALTILPQCKAFVEARPCVSS